MRRLLCASAFYFVVVVIFGAPFNERCGKNEFYNDCSLHPVCEVTCENYNEPVIMCASDECTPGCKCLLSHARHKKTGLCIRPSLCSHYYYIKYITRYFSSRY
ncbi:hypothetical protein ILUMI_12341 [Ignelater luminosus]|uniref:TIL domain-containing protein n=1 Tax=Ignelater luminosus TaxID=2038154 RepID=A0A8K0CZS1_IGNLU|nr:hypothetical protein ILUMI_12341 [Ignelater luminosus]